MSVGDYMYYGDPSRYYGSDEPWKETVSDALSKIENEYRENNTSINRTVIKLEKEIEGFKKQIEEQKKEYDTLLKQIETTKTQL